jgi:branched-chain amino acid transport system ATP-binding protein
MVGSSVLEVKSLSISFGGLQALTNVSFEVNSREIVGLIGPNGAGKTTVFNLITGIYQPTAGVVRLSGVPITGKKVHRIVKMGAARTFQNIRLFKRLSVLDNVKIAYNRHMKYNVIEGTFRLPSYWREEREADERAMELLRVFNLEGSANEPAGGLPYGKQRELEICRAMISEPKVLLLDEPAAGMNPTETRNLMDTIKEIKERFGVGILLIEHDMSLVMRICERIVVLDYGQVIATGTPDEIKRNEKVIGAYLGGGGAIHA